MKYRCVIFDMDGTLTDEHLDFQIIREEIGIGAEVDILAALEAMSEADRLRAESILLTHEMTAAREAPPADGACEIVRKIQSTGAPTAVLTRNTRPAMELVLQRFGLTFDLTFSREDGPIKPSPESILTACGILGVRPAETACVGDWVLDIVAANAAGCTSVLLARGRELEFADQADHVIEKMWDLAGILGI